MKLGQLVQARKGYNKATSPYIIDLIPGNVYTIVSTPEQSLSNRTFLSGIFDSYGTHSSRKRLGFKSEDLRLVTNIRRK